MDILGIIAIGLSALVVYLQVDKENKRVRELNLKNQIIEKKMEEAPTGLIDNDKLKFDGKTLTIKKK